MLLNSSKRRKAANPRVHKQASLKSFKLAADVCSIFIDDGLYHIWRNRNFPIDSWLTAFRRLQKVR